MFLSIVLTLVLSLLLWLSFGIDLGNVDGSRPLLSGVSFFVAAGILATVFGRLTNFRSIALSGAIRSSLFRRLIPVFSTILAFTILGERYSSIGMAGMILCSIGLAIWARTPHSAPMTELIHKSHLQLGLLFGAASAFCYALAYVARKLAMDDLPDPALGALVGALTGVLWYIVASAVSARYRRSLTRVFTDAEVWQWLAALGMSFGQLLLFFALISAPVAVVAIIGSLEMLFAAYLAAFLFRSEPVPGRILVFSTLISAAGVAMVSVG